MPRWLIPIRVVELGREAVVDAPTKREALRLFREQRWEELTDADRYKVTKVGAITKVDQ